MFFVLWNYGMLFPSGVVGEVVQEAWVSVTGHLLTQVCEDDSLNSSCVFVDGIVSLGTQWVSCSATSAQARAITVFKVSCCFVE